MRKVAVSLADSVDLRIILSVLYIITEVIRNEKVAGSSDFQDIAETFSNDLSKFPFKWKSPPGPISTVNLASLTISRCSNRRWITFGETVKYDNAVLWRHRAPLSHEKGFTIAMENLIGQFGRHGYATQIKG